jgi:microcystin-dependent protein
MSDPFVAEIRIFSFNFAPVGWAACDGQVLPISQNTALFSLIGTYYGGNGTSNFALPNLQGAAPMFYGQAPGLSQYSLGQSAGSPAVTLPEAELPSHTHALQAYVGRGTNEKTPGPQAVLASSQGNYVYDSATNPPTSPMSPQMITAAGGGQAHNNMMPYLTLGFYIALQGIFPPRS